MTKGTIEHFLKMFETELKNGDVHAIYKKLGKEFYVFNEILLELGYTINQILTLIDNPKVIPENMFYDCDSLKLQELNLTNIEEIGEFAFYECDYIDTVKLGEGLVKVHSMAFNHCVRMRHLWLPSTIKYIGAFGFYTLSGSLYVTVNMTKEEWDKNVVKDSTIFMSDTIIKFTDQTIVW